MSTTTSFPPRLPSGGVPSDPEGDTTSVGPPVLLASSFPVVGAVYQGYQLLAELGRGAAGCVFLAKQPTLADRPVVLKIGPREGQEHLSLARLQHTGIVPLYAVHDDPGRDQRVLCMPYLGGTTLGYLLRVLAADAARPTTGRQLLDALDRAQGSIPVVLPSRGPNRQLLARASYVQAVCWIGACLADALQYAHERGLVHFDLKPSNILLAADGQPMLLDFHLARGPVRAGDPAPESLGGTALYMSPEQALTLDAVVRGRPVPADVDGRSDVYSLGLMLYEALGGTFPVDLAGPPTLRRDNPDVSPGLARLIHKCLRKDPRQRYATAGALAADLRRHLADQPLVGVPDRDLRERWQKWRRRRPQAFARLGMALALAAAGVIAAALFATRASQQEALRGQARAALDEGQLQLKDRQYAAAVRSLTHGLSLADDLADDGLAQALQGRLRLARRAQLADELHALADALRFRVGPLPAGPAARLDAGCRSIWQGRELLTDAGDARLPDDLEQQIRADLLDLALLWTGLRVERAGPAEFGPAAAGALQVLAEAQAAYGPSAVLCHERQALAAALGRVAEAEAAARLGAQFPPRSAWEHYALGHSLLRLRERLPGPAALPCLALAHAQFDQAVALGPHNLWPLLYRGRSACELGRYHDAAQDFQACVALAPEAAACYYYRALANAALGHRDRARSDYTRALELDPRLAPAALNRGVLSFQEGRYPEARADFQYALECGADPAVVRHNLALMK